MKRYKLLMFGLLVVFVAVPSFARESVTLALLKDSAAADAATPEGKAYLKEFFTNPWMLAMDAADEQCRAAQSRAGSPEDWVIALRIGDDGYPTEALVSPDNEGLKCMADRLKTNSFIRPPHEGFAIYLHYRHVEPGTEAEASAPAE
jgi:hypothetical protein